MILEEYKQLTNEIIDILEKIPFSGKSENYRKENMLTYHFNENKKVFITLELLENSYEFCFYINGICHKTTNLFSFWQRRRIRKIFNKKHKEWVRKNEIQKKKDFVEKIKILIRKMGVE